MKNLKQVLLVVLSSGLLNACGGGSSDGSTPPGNIGSVSSKNFSVALKNVDIRRVSNDAAIDLDTSAISSGTLILNQ